MSDDDIPIKTGPASQAYLDNWERIFGEKPKPRKDEDAIECAVKSYANLIVPLEAQIGPIEQPDLHVGWRCPCCVYEGREIDVIDFEERYFLCGSNFVPGGRRHSFDDIP